MCIIQCLWKQNSSTRRMTVDSWSSPFWIAFTPFASSFLTNWIIACSVPEWYKLNPFSGALFLREEILLDLVLSTDTASPSWSTSESSSPSSPPNTSKGSSTSLPLIVQVGVVRERRSFEYSHTSWRKCELNIEVCSLASPKPSNPLNFKFQKSPYLSSRLHEPWSPPQHWLGAQLPSFSCMRRVLKQSRFHAYPMNWICHENGISYF